MKKAMVNVFLMLSTLLVFASFCNATPMIGTYTLTASLVSGSMAINDWTVGTGYQISFNFDDENTTYHSYNDGLDLIGEFAAIGSDDSINSTTNQSTFPNMIYGDDVQSLLTPQIQSYALNPTASSRHWARHYRAGSGANTNTWTQVQLDGLLMNFSDDGRGYYIQWSGGNVVRFDNASFIASPSPVPEPATMLLFGTGVAGLIGSRTRRKGK